MLNKINVSKIITSHLGTLINDNSNKAGLDDWFTFLILPLVVSGTLSYFCVTFSEQAINIIITTLSIIVGLLFNVIVIIFDIIKRDKSNGKRNKLVEQLLANISYTILISILSILVTFVTFIKNDCIEFLANSILFFLLTHFLVTVVMILKRLYYLFLNEINDQNNIK